MTDKKHLTISEFVKTYYIGKTRTAYSASIRKFAQFISGIEKKGRMAKPEEIAVYDKVMLDYLNSNPSFSDDIEKYLVYLKSKEVPPKTIRLYFMALKQYLEHNDVEFTTKQLRLIKHKLPKGHASTIEKDLTVETLRKIIEHTDIKGKALILFLSSTGVRIGEAMQIAVNELSLNETPACVTIRGNKSMSIGRPRYIFISKESKAAIMEWLKVREKYLQAAVNKNRQLVKNGLSAPKDVNDDRLFPFSVDVAEKLWTTAVTNAGLMSKDKVTNIIQLRIHQLRKFFRSQMGEGHCPRDIFEALMGHNEYLDIAYRRYNKKQMADYYLKAETHLYINASEDLEELREEFNVKTEATQELVQKLAVENNEQRKKFENKLKEKDEQIRDITIKHDNLVLRMEGTIEKMVRDRVDAYKKETPLDEKMLMKMINQTNEDFRAHLDRIENEKESLKQEIERLKMKK